VSCMVFKGMSALYLKNYPEALAALNQAIDIDPNNPPFYNFRGKYYFKIGDYPKALADYNKAVQLGGKEYAPDYEYQEAALKKK
jgi:tetratricopeptide (TPR) repeat protein